MAGVPQVRSTLASAPAQLLMRAARRRHRPTGCRPAHLLPCPPAPPPAAGLTVDVEGEPGGTYPLLAAADGTSLTFSLEDASKQSKATDAGGGPALVVSGLQLRQFGARVGVEFTPQPDGSLLMTGAPGLWVVHC